MSRIDFFTGLGLMALGTWVWIMCMDFAAAPLGLGPGDYPRVASGGLFVFGLILAVQNAAKLFKAQAAAAKIPKGALPRVAFLVGWSIAYILFMPLTGFVLATPVYLFVGMLFFGLKKYPTGIITSLAVTLVVFFLFRYSFQIMLPIVGLFDLF